MRLSENKRDEQQTDPWFICGKMARNHVKCL